MNAFNRASLKNPALAQKSLTKAGQIVQRVKWPWFGPLIALFSVIGAGSLVKDSVWAPLLVVFLVIGGIGRGVTYRRHRSISHCRLTF